MHFCLHRVPGALTISTVSWAHHADADVAGTCLAGTEHGSGQIAMTSWSNLSSAADDFGARGYLTGVEMFWNIGDALFPIYRHAALLFGGRGSAGDIKNDTWMIPITLAPGSPAALTNATKVRTHGEPAPARWGHSAVWTGRGSDRAETWATSRSYAGTIDENDDLISKQGHPIQDIRHTISGKLQGDSTISPCQSGITMHKQSELQCDSLHGRSGGCSCVRLEIHSRISGVLDTDTVVADTASSLYPSVWSGRRLEIISGAGLCTPKFALSSSSCHAEFHTLSLCLFPCLCARRWISRVYFVQQPEHLQPSPCSRLSIGRSTRRHAALRHPRGRPNEDCVGAIGHDVGIWRT